MAVHFHQLTIKQLNKETPDSVVITLEIPEPLREAFRFIPGQNLTVKTNLNGEEIRRSYSICSAPFENKLCIAVKKIDQGKFSAYANEYLQQGDTIEVLPPTGRFIINPDPNQKKQYLAFAAGSGITPVISIIKAILTSEPSSTFTLVYGNRTRASIMFFEELEGLKNKYVERFNLINILSREKTDVPINFGRIDNPKLAALKSLVNYKLFNEVFICGPTEMLFCVKDYLIKQGLDETHIHFELFTTPGQKLSVPANATIEKNDASKSKVTIISDGRSLSFDLPFESDSILDAALKQGVDLPFACKGGVCSTCRAKLMEGKVTMDSNYALEKDEVAAGYILTCQSHPLTENVVANFDLR